MNTVSRPGRRSRRMEAGLGALSGSEASSEKRSRQRGSHAPVSVIMRIAPAYGCRVYIAPAMCEASDARCRCGWLRGWRNELR